MTLESIPKQPSLPEGYYYHAEGYLWFVLPIEEFADLPAIVGIDGMALAKKSEFHVTVINARRIAREIGGADPKDVVRTEQDLQDLLAEYVRDHSIEFVRFEDDLRLATSAERTSIAARCVMRGIEGYFENIRMHYDFLLPAQPAHVSLYTLPGGGAVGIDTKEEMESYNKVDLPAVQAVLNSIT